mgnify:CR=1 FL=1
MGRKVKYMERHYFAANGVEEKTRFAVSVSAKPRAGKANASSLRQQEANRNQAAHILGRLLNNNFSQGDLFLSPGYSREELAKLKARAKAALGQVRPRKEKLENAILAEVDKDARRFIRRLKDAGAVGLKYVIVPSDREKKGSALKPAAPHVHIILSCEQIKLEQKRLTVCGRTLVDLWGHAESVEHEFLRSGPLNKLAAYLIAQTRTIPNRKKYTCSRNLVPVRFEE